ncbi:MAG: glycosyltransferase [Sedimenticola sp.]|nr:glycosyltransferase [Sedimenticola sp.]
MKNSKRVLVVAGEYPPLKTIGRIRTAKFVEHMRKFGWQPYVLTVSYKESDGNYFKELVDEIPDDVKVFRVENDTYDEQFIRIIKRLLSGITSQNNHVTTSDNISQINSTSKIKNTKDNHIKDILLRLYKSFFKQWVNIPDDYIIWSNRAHYEALTIIKEHDIDLIYTSLPPISAAITGYKLKLATSLPWIVDYRDLWTGDVLREWINPLRNRYEVYLEKKLIKKADVVIAVSEQKTDYLKKLHTSASCHWATLTNGYDKDVFEPLLKEQNKVKGHSDTLNFVYTGRLFKNRRGYAFAEALGQLSEEHPELIRKVSVQIYGGVSEEIMKRYDEILKHYKIEHLYHFHGDVSYMEAMKAQVNADYLLLIVDTGLTSDGVIPGKLFEYIASQRPIFALCNEGATKDIIERANAGIVVPVESVKECKKSLYNLLQINVPVTPSFDVQYLEQFDRNNISKKLTQLFDRTIASYQAND